MKYDPIDAARVPPPAPPPKRGATRPAKEAKADPPAPATPLAVEGGSAAAAPPEPDYPMLVPGVLLRVVNKGGKNISWHGAITHLAEGHVFDPSGYGAEGLARIRAQGVELEEVKEG